ncbi:MAG: amino acid permease [Planctomycetes bacterium]|nr:amino acid permease [Planctomycetota bacterium]
MERRFGELKRVLGPATGIAVCVGSAVGSGVLRTPGEIAAALPSGPWILFAWLVGATVAALDIFILAEWAASVPRVGGLVAYLRTAFGPAVAFVFGWLILLITWPGSIASVAIAIGEVVAEGAGSLATDAAPTHEARAIAIFVIVGLAALNLVGIHFGARLEIIFTSLKVTLLLGLLVAATFAVGSRAAATTGSVAAFPATPGLLAVAFGGAMIKVIFTYDGYADAVYLSEETRNPEKSVPRVLFISLIIITGLYLFCNIAFLSVFGARGMANSKFVPLELMQYAFGASGTKLLTIAAVAVMLGAVNSYLLTGPRIARLLAEERLALPVFGRVTSRGVPVAATLWLAVVSVILCFSNSYGELLEAVVPIISLTTIFVAAGLWLERWRHPERPRPFRVPAIGLVAGGQILLGSFLLYNGAAFVAEKNPWILAGDAAAVAAGLLIYYFTRTQRAAR